MKKKILMLMALSLAAGAVWAVGLSGLIINNPGLAYNHRYVFDLQNADVNQVSATAVYSSASFSAGTFSTGQVSTGAITVATAANLIQATATNTLTVADNALISTACVSFAASFYTPPGRMLCGGRDWRAGASAHLTAVNIAAAMTAAGLPSAANGAALITSTAPAPGARYNAIAFKVTTTGLTLGHSTMTGGRDQAIIYVNGSPLKNGKDFLAVSGDNNQTAESIKNAINASTFSASAFLTATRSSAVITLTSKLAGAVYNFSLSSNAGAAVTFTNGGRMVNGITPSWQLGGRNITIASHGFTTALPLLYATGSGSPAIGGLTTQTTYYAIPIDANTVQLATSSAQAVLGVGKVLTSSSTLSAAKSYTLTPLSFLAGSAGFDWEVSNDNVNWSTLGVASITYTSPGTYSWDFGQLNLRYLSLNFTAPTQGAISLQVTATSKAGF